MFPMRSWYSALQHIIQFSGKPVAELHNSLLYSTFGIPSMLMRVATHAYRGPVPCIQMRWLLVATAPHVHLRFPARSHRLAIIYADWWMEERNDFLFLWQVLQPSVGLSDWWSRRHMKLCSITPPNNWGGDPRIKTSMLYWYWPISLNSGASHFGFASDVIIYRVPCSLK
jgi:hypothetical protein